MSASSIFGLSAAEMEWCLHPPAPIMGRIWTPVKVEKHKPLMRDETDQMFYNTIQEIFDWYPTIKVLPPEEIVREMFWVENPIQRRFPFYSGEMHIIRAGCGDTIAALRLEDRQFVYTRPTLTSPNKWIPYDGRNYRRKEMYEFSNQFFEGGDPAYKPRVKRQQITKSAVPFRNLSSFEKWQSLPERKLRVACNQWHKGEKRLSHICELVGEMGYSPNSTVKNISSTRPAFNNPPQWSGEARPKGYREVHLTSNYPSSSYLTDLVSNYGYSGSAAFSAMSHAHTPWVYQIDRRHARTLEGGDNETPATEHEHQVIMGDRPYVPASPFTESTMPTFKKKTVQAEIDKHRWSPEHKTACFDVVYLKREPELVAASLGYLNVQTVSRHATRIRHDIRLRLGFEPAAKKGSFACPEIFFTDSEEVADEIVHVEP